MKPQSEPAITFLLTILPDKSEGSTLHAEAKHVGEPTKLGWLTARHRVGWRR